MDIVMSTGFQEIDDCTGGFGRHSTTLIVAPPGFGKTEYAHHLVMMADQIERTRLKEFVTAIVTEKPDALPDLPDAYADYVIKVPEASMDGAQVLLELDQLPVRPELVIAIDVMDEVLVALAEKVRQYSTLIVFATSNAGPYDERRPLHEIFLRSEVVIYGEFVETEAEEDRCWTVVKNKHGAVGVRTGLNRRTRGDWQS